MGRGWMWQSLVILIDCKISVLDLQRETEHIQVISFQRVRKEQWSMTETLHGHHAVFPWRLGKFPKGVVVSGKVTLICDWQEHMTGNRTPQSRAQAGSLSPTEVPQCHLPNPLLYQNDAALFRETRKTFLPQSPVKQTVTLVCLWITCHHILWILGIAVFLKNFWMQNLGSNVGL